MDHIIKTSDNFDKETPMRTKQENLIILSFAIFLGVYCINFLWNFWSHGYNTLGIGATFFGLLMLGFFTYTQRKELTIKSLSWIMPLTLIMLSLGIYTNPFIKVINIILIPFLYLIFTTHETKELVRKALWSKLFLSEFLAATLRVIGSFFKSISAIGKLTQKETTTKSKEATTQGEMQTSSSKKTHSAYKQITIGLGIFAILAVTIVIPLLSSADPRFANLFENIIDYFISFVSLEGLVKTLFAIGVSCTFFGYRLYWQKNYKPFVEISQQADIRSYSPMIGTILIGLLGLYGLFLFLQAQNLFASVLPTDFKVTETLVKSGFWQLLVLTALNTVLYTTIFGKTIRWVQYILGAFTIASLLLLFSAVQRVYLYVTVYGLSYEKFFAFYTVLFCVGMFIWFIYLMITKKKHIPIFKALCFSALWLYAAATVFPVERFVLTTNLAMTKNENSRIDLNELHMLSFDAVSTFDKKKQEILRESEADKREVLERLQQKQTGIYLSKQNENVTFEWNSWRERKIQRMHSLRCYYCDDTKDLKKKWHEKTLTELLYKTNQRNDDHTSEVVTWTDPYNGFAIKYDPRRIEGPYSQMHVDSYNIFNYKNDIQSENQAASFSVERYYTDGLKKSTVPTAYIIQKDEQKVVKNGSFEELLQSSPSFALNNVTATVIPRQFRNNATILSLYIEAPNGYFIISPNYYSMVPKPSSQENFPQTFEEYMTFIGANEHYKQTISSFALIKQDLSH